MSAKPLSLAALLSLVLAWPAAAQPPAMRPGAPIELAPAPAPAPAPSSAGVLMLNGLTPLPNSSGARWLEENSPLPVGRNGPIGQEVYFNTGPTYPVGDGVFGLHLDAGWMIEAGGRALFFTPENDAAMTAKVGFTYQENQGKTNAPTYKFFGIDVRTKSLIRTSAVTAIGRDWFRPWGGRNGGENTFRFGADAGGRYGTEMVSFEVVNDPVQNTTFRHRSDVFGGVVVGVHAALEVPMRSWVWFAGIRFEYGYNWSNLLPDQNSNIHDLNTLFQTGFRY